MTEPIHVDRAEAEETRRLTFSAPVSASIVGIFVLLLLGALYYARDFVLPIVLAILLALVFAPVVRFLGRRGVPAAVAAVLVFVGLGLAAIGTTLALSAPVTRLVEDAPQISAKIRERVRPYLSSLALVSRVSQEVDRMTDGVEASPGQQEVVIAQPGLISWARGGLTGLGSTLMATLLLTPFLLASRNALRHKLVRIRRRLSSQKHALQVFNDVENEVSRYLFTIATINVGLGILVGATMAILGMPSPLLWGVGATLLNFIPFAGATIGIVLAAAVALVTFDSVAAAALPPLAYLALQIVEGSFVTPIAVGRRLDINIVAFLIALALATWMWGIIGAMIGVPILVVIKVFCDHIPELEAVSVMLSGEGHVEEGEEKPAS